jgi:type I restriction enzyme S subunit
MEKWTTGKMSDLIEFNPKERISKGENAKKIAMDKLKPFERDIEGYEIAQFKGGSKFRNGDTLLARITPCLENGKTAQVNVLEDNEVGFGSTEFIVLRAKPGVSDKDYIYYLAISPLVREQAIQSMVGSSGRQRVQQGVLNDLDICIHPLSEQIEIGRTLKVLDDKIAINTKINHHLAA